MVVAPAARRSTLVERPDRLELIVPAKRNFFVLMFLPAWLAMWAFALVNVVRELFSGSKGPVPFLLFWLVGWTVGGGFALFVFLWMLAGRERISLQPRVLAVRRDLFGFGVTREYDLAQIRNVRVSAVPYDPSNWATMGRFWGLGGGPVAFDYGARTIRLAAAVEEPEATQIVSELKRRHTFPD